MGETQEEMPKLEALMAEDPMTLFRSFPPIPVVEIITQVRFPDGTVVERRHTESAAVWPHLRAYEQGRVIRKVADEVAAQIDWERYNR